MPEQKLEQLRLFLFHQLRHGDSGVNVRHRVVRVIVFHAVGLSQELQLKAWQPLIIFWPVDAVGTQRVAGAHDIQQIPARIAVLPAPGVGIVKVAIKNIARHFIVEAHVVIADHAGVFDGKQGMNASGEFRFSHSARLRQLRRNAGDHHRLRLWQIIVRWLAVKNLRLADDIEIHIGANAGELRRAIQRRAFAEGLVIVEEEGWLVRVIAHWF